MCVGAALGTAWEKAMPYFDQYTHIAVIVIALVVVAAAVFYFVRWKKKKSAGEKDSAEGE